MIDAILEADRQVPRKQRHTAKRVFERLRDEHGFDGQYTIVKDYVRERRRRTQEMFVPLSHAPGHAQCDFGEAVAVISGVERKVNWKVLSSVRGWGRLRGSKSIDRCSSLIYHYIDRTPHASRKIGAPRGGIFCPVIST